MDRTGLHGYQASHVAELEYNGASDVFVSPNATLASSRNRELEGSGERQRDAHVRAHAR
jgi:hypothetical protein